jgi:iron donor protein CyaY
MLEKDFLKKCEEFLFFLSENLEKKDKNSLLDIDYSDGILTIKIDSTSEVYVINRHSASKKIWYSSPFSGADYFSFDDKSKQWLNGNNQELSEKLFSELYLCLD